MKPWHFWVRPEDLRPGDKKVEDPAFIAKMRATLLQNQANRARRKAERAEKKANGTATAPSTANASPERAPERIDTTGFEARANEMRRRAQEFLTSKPGVVRLSPKDRLSNFLRTQCKPLAELSTKFVENFNQDAAGKVWNHDVLRGGRNAEASYHQMSGLIDIRPETGRALVEGMARGALATSAYAVKTYTHEVMHAASSEHEYEHFGGRRPHAAMEEATTELCAQHFAADMARGLGISDSTGKLGYDAQALFSVKMETPPRTGILSGEYAPPSAAVPTIKAEKPTAYTLRCKRFAQTVAVVEYMDPQDRAKWPASVGGVALNQSIRDWAYALKRTRGSMRYERLAHRYLQRAGVDEKNAARFESARASVAKVLRDHFAETHKGKDWNARNEGTLHEALWHVANRYRR